ncbi:hypothetical protein [Hymenobacter metallilatus]|uniref:Lipoprotein n=1 Tax=Hymenobacter metallilatus TaxID=2493666 RepID=A0A428JEV8_9BACT|nr:hypothetical protein [Hymenobacter metallilatus]RSK31052.1 hypothetical protein EI290_13595 [Hymenobacter metallilatus]
MLQRLIVSSVATVALSGCARFAQLSQLPDGYYSIRAVSNDTLRQQLTMPRMYVQQRTDTLAFTPPATTAAVPPTLLYQLRGLEEVRLLHRSFDLDIFSIPFKALPPRQGFPVQLNTNFNAALYVGRRLDFYRLRNRRLTPFRARPFIRSNGFGYGLFGGLGSSIITPDLTGQHAVTDYEGFTLHGGAAFIYDARLLNIGLAAGVDHLLGPDARYWAYQNRPWIGVLFGLDLN